MFLRLRRVFKNDVPGTNTICTRNSILSLVRLCQRTYHIPSSTLDRNTKLMTKDQVSHSNELIYQLARPKIFAGCLTALNILMATAPLVGLRIYYERNGLTSHTSEEVMNLMGETMVYLTETECYVAIAIGIVAALVVHRMCVLHPIRVYWDHQSAKYTAIFVNSFFPWKFEKHEFNTIRRSYRSAVMDGKRAVLHIEYFKIPSDYYKFCDDEITRRR